jgi:hypothetical protein
VKDRVKELLTRNNDGVVLFPVLAIKLPHTVKDRVKVAHPE